MSEKKELSLEELDAVSGGQITYTWDGESGTIGIDGNNRYLLVNKQGFLDYYNANKDTMTESDILYHLKQLGYVKKR